jgi:hypothetical protein
MPTFKVVLDGIDLSDDHSRHISQAIQQAVLHELAALDAPGGREPASARSSFALLPINQGQTRGLVATEPPIEGRMAELMKSEFEG